jgi:hypothetical protein
MDKYDFLKMKAESRLTPVWLSCLAFAAVVGVGRLTYLLITLHPHHLVMQLFPLILVMLFLAREIWLMLKAESPTNRSAAITVAVLSAGVWLLIAVQGIK